MFVNYDKWETYWACALVSYIFSHTTRSFSPSGSLLEFFVLKLVVCNHILFNKVVIEKLNIIILNPINQVPRLFLINLNFMCKHKRGSSSSI